MGQREKAHSILESVIRTVASTGQDHTSTLDIPHSELSQDAGFIAQYPITGNCRITIIAEYMNEDDYIYEKESGITTKNKTPSQ